MRRSRSQPAHLDTLRQLATHGSAPSIPTKFQSFGYEETETGDLRLQEPLKPGFTGVKNDTVGPGDYDPKPSDSRHHRAPASLFHKVHRTISLQSGFLFSYSLVSRVPPGRLERKPVVLLVQDTTTSSLPLSHSMTEHLMEIFT